MPKTRRCRKLNCHAMVEYPFHYCAIHKSEEVAYNESRRKWSEANSQRRYKEYDRQRQSSVGKSEQHAFYQTKQWHTLREVVLRRDNYLCQYCKTHGRIREGVIIDHVVPYEVEPWNKSNVENLATCCRSCHYRKTMWEQKYYGTGQSNKNKKIEKIIPVRKISDVPDFKTN